MVSLCHLLLLKFHNLNNALMLTIFFLFHFVTFFALEVYSLSTATDFVHLVQ